MPQSVLLAELTREQIRRLAPEATVVLPTAAIEQHGPHLPTLTDTAACGAVCQRAAEAAAAEGATVLVAPVMWIGHSHHHFPHPGVLSLSTGTFVQVLRELGDSVGPVGLPPHRDRERPRRQRRAGPRRRARHPQRLQPAGRRAGRGRRRAGERRLGRGDLVLDGGLARAGAGGRGRGARRAARPRRRLRDLARARAAARAGRRRPATRPRCRPGRSGPCRPRRRP